MDSTTSISGGAGTIVVAGWSVGWDIKIPGKCTAAVVATILSTSTEAAATHEVYSVHTLGMKQAFPKRVLSLLPISILVALAGCAATGPNNLSAKPVLYPNATLTRVGEAQARAEMNACMARAAQAGLTPDQKTSQIGRRASEGAATAGVASAVGALISGRNNDILRAGAAGAAIGGSAGAVSGAFHNDKANPVYRQFVQRCLSEKGFDVIGWN